MCPLCKKPEFDYVATRLDKLNIVRCRECNLAYINPRPIAEDIAKMYKEDHYVGHEDTQIDYNNYSPSVVSIKCYPPYGWELLLEETLLANMRTLDIGCAFGWWLYWMAKEGAKATGIDLAPEGGCCAVSQAAAFGQMVAGSKTQRYILRQEIFWNSCANAAHQS